MGNGQGLKDVEFEISSNWNSPISLNSSFTDLHNIDMKIFIKCDSLLLEP